MRHSPAPVLRWVLASAVSIGLLATIAPSQGALLVSQVEGPHTSAGGSSRAARSG
jgi:hypothetical protein